MDIIVKMKFGAHLYGTANEQSDLDLKGIFLPSKEAILLGNIAKCHNFTTGPRATKNNPYDVDYEVYSLHYFIKLACDGQTVAMDMLHAPEIMIIENSPIWQSIVAQKHRFYTKSLSSFISYARRQASKYGIKGSRLNTVAEVLDLFKTQNATVKLRALWDDLPRNEFCHDVGTDPNGMRQYQVCGKTFQESSAIGYVIPILERYYSEYGHRAQLAAQNKNIDWKAISHALRAAMQTKEILTEDTITFPLKEAAFLRQVKEGTLNYANEVAPVLESLIAEVESLIEKSSLPEKVDVSYWDSFLCETIESARFNN